MHSWEIVCIETDDDSEYEDCRSITELGYLAPILRKKSSDVVGAQIEQGHSEFHITIDGTRHELQPSKDPDVYFYVRTLDEDDPSDPLCSLKSCEDYESEERFGEN